jgi:16S rRNA (adenine1518-N6/adenine1519-N6)-dimethyltransferase
MENIDLSSKKVLKNILEKYEIHPQKKFGQNFLINEKNVEQIISAAELSSNDIILEIGPGLGTLTQKLCQKAKKVIAVEKDERMVAILKKTLKEYKNVEIIHGDILKVQSSKLKVKSYKVVGSLPFYIATRIIRQFLETDNLPKEMVLVVQKEVGRRICSLSPNKMNLLAVSTQFYATQM